MQKTNISPSIYQEFLDSAANARDKGQAQFYTPTDLARTLALPLPRCRPAICDLTCGNGQLLIGSAGSDTETLLGCDIDHIRMISPKPDTINLIGQSGTDITRFAQLLHDVHWQSDILVLNPPWSLEWYAERMPFLKFGSSVTLVDSTLATFLLALHFLTDRGEALFIANTATVDRLLRPLPQWQHVWGELTLDGNPCTGRADTKFQKVRSAAAASVPQTGSSVTLALADVRTSVLYIQKSWTQGPRSRKACTGVDLPAAVGSIAHDRETLGLSLNLRYRHQHHPDTVPLWRAAAEEWKRRTVGTTSTSSSYNLWLENTGPGGSPVIRTHLSLYDAAAHPTLKAQASLLHHLNGQSPLKLVTQRTERDLLLGAAGLDRHRGQASRHRPQGATLWKVQPALQEEIKRCLTEYHKIRAPLVPLPEIQRLGYLEEEDTITCKQDLIAQTSTATSASRLFVAGKTYQLGTRSVPILRIDTRYNPLNDRDDLIQYTGAELATFITDEHGAQKCFMEARLKNAQSTYIDPVADGAAADGYHSSVNIDFTLQDLVTHFHIPEVPTITQLQPDKYQANLKALQELENFLAA